MYVDVTVYTQIKEDNQWGMFDYELTRLDDQSKRLRGSSYFEDDVFKKMDFNVELCSLRTIGTCVLTRTSKHEMKQVAPADLNPNTSQLD